MAPTKVGQPIVNDSHVYVAVVRELQASRPLSTVSVGFLRLRRNHHFTLPLEDKMGTIRTTTSNLIVPQISWVALR